VGIAVNILILHYFNWRQLQVAFGNFMKIIKSTVY